MKQIIYNVETGIVNIDSIITSEEGKTSFTLNENEYWFEYNDPIIQMNLKEIEFNSFEKQKGRKILEIGNHYQQLEDAGYTNQAFNITLGYSDNDRNMFNQLLTMIGLANDLGETIDSVPIADVNNIVHQFTLVNLKYLLLQYGMAYQTLWGTYSTYRQMVLNATTIEELNEISWS